MSDMDDKDRSRERSRRGDRPSRFTENSRDRSHDRGRERGSMKSSSNRVYVSNIPYEYRWQDMKDLFRDHVGDVQFVELFVDDNDKPKGSGIVEFSDSSSVRKCMEVMQRYEVKGRKLVIKEDVGNMRDKHGGLVGGKRSRDNDRMRDDHRHRDQQMGGSNMSLRQDDVKWGNTYGLSPHFLESLSIDAPLVNKVFIANLEYNIDKKKLKDVFRLAGKVLRVDLPIDKDGRSRGFAVVEFDHPVEAVQAISMFNNQVLFDRSLTVRMDRANETFKLPDGLKSIGMGLGPNGEPLKNVAHNLPSLANTQQSTGGAGILGAVPNNSLQLANALGLGNIGALSNLSNQQMLQASNLSGLASNLLGNGLGGADLSSLVASAQNPLQNQATQQQLAALAAQSSASSNTNNMSSYGRGGGDNSFNNSGSAFGSQTQSPSFNASSLLNSSRFQSQSQNTSSSFGGGNSGYGNDRGGQFGNSSGGGGGGSGGNLLRSQSDRGSDKNFSRKVLINNLPPTANYKMLHEKFTEYGDVHSFEEKSPGTVLVGYGSEWQAERAIKNLDRARIDGRMIDARLYY